MSVHIEYCLHGELARLNKPTITRAEYDLYDTESNKTLPTYRVVFSANHTGCRGIDIDSRYYVVRLFDPSGRRLDSGSGQVHRVIAKRGLHSAVAWAKGMAISLPYRFEIQN